jgi:PPP family 3-phenylpropionic acid transporter
VPLKRILILCLLGALAVNGVLIAARPGFWGMAAIFLALGVLELNAYPLLDSMAVQFISVGLEVRYSLSRGLGSLSYAVACVALGRQAAALGVETLLWTHLGLLVLMILVSAAFPAFPKEALPPLAEGERPHSVWYLIRSSRSFAWMLAAVFFALAAVMPIVSFMVSLVGKQGGDESHLGLALFLMAASELPAALLFRPCAGGWAAAETLALSVVFMGLKPLFFLLAPDLWWLLAVQPIQMLGYGLFTPAAVYYANENVSQADRIQGQSVMMMASNGLGACSATSWRAMPWTGRLRSHAA